MRHGPVAVVFALAAMSVPLARASAEEIRVLSSVGIKAVLDELVPRFERMTGHEVTTIFGLASVLKTEIDGGAPFDVAILTPPPLDALIANGTVSRESRADVARVGLGLMIRAGAPKPNLDTVESFKRTLSNDGAVTYATAGASGVAFVAAIEALGIADAVGAKALPAATTEEVAANVTAGRAAFAVLPVSEILPVAGAELGAVFPQEVQTYVVMVAGVSTHSAASAAAGELVAFLMAPVSDDAVAASGMERVPSE